MQYIYNLDMEIMLGYQMKMRIWNQKYYIKATKNKK